MNPARSFGPALVNGQWRGPGLLGWTDHRGRRTALIYDTVSSRKRCGDPGTDQLGEVALPSAHVTLAEGSFTFAIPARWVPVSAAPTALGVLPKNPLVVVP